MHGLSRSAAAGTAGPDGARPCEDRVEGARGEPAGEGVLLRDVVRSRRAARPSPRSWAAPWPNAKRARGGTAAGLAQHAPGSRPWPTRPSDEHGAQLGEQRPLAGEVLAAARDLGRGRLVGGRRAARHRRRCSSRGGAGRRRGDRRRLAGEAGAVEGGEEEVAGAVAGEDAAGAVAAVGGGGEAHDQEPRPRVAEARARAGPSTPASRKRFTFSRATSRHQRRRRGQRSQRDDVARESARASRSWATRPGPRVLALGRVSVAVRPRRRALGSTAARWRALRGEARLERLHEVDDLGPRGLGRGRDLLALDLALDRLVVALADLVLVVLGVELVARRSARRAAPRASAPPPCTSASSIGTSEIGRTSSA